MSLPQLVNSSPHAYNTLPRAWDSAPHAHEEGHMPHKSRSVGPGIEVCRPSGSIPMLGSSEPVRTGIEVPCHRDRGRSVAEPRSHRPMGRVFRLQITRLIAHRVESIAPGRSIPLPHGSSHSPRSGRSSTCEGTTCMREGSSPMREGTTPGTDKPAPDDPRCRVHGRWDRGHAAVIPGYCGGVTRRCPRWESTSPRG